MVSTPYLNEKRAVYASPRSLTKRKAIIIVSLVALAIVIIVVVVAVYFGVVKHNSSKSDAATGISSGSSKTSSSAAPVSSSSGAASKGSLVVTGGDGSKVTTSDGSTFTYQNSFGGYWYYDPTNPMANYARAQSWTPALNESFNYGVDQIRGVNLGGWLVTEPLPSNRLCSVPALYQKYLNASTVAVDEWTLSENMASDTASGGLQQLEDHYATFVTEQDFAEIAGAGLNYIRIPLPYWAIETRTGEPFLAKVSWTYFLKAIEWARKYGLRINLDFHSLPGSQNGWNHSGKLGSINVLNGPMGLANAQRSLDYIRIIAEFISQPEYSPVVAMFGVTNEPVGSTIGFQNLASYYVQAYALVREASGIGAGNGPFISFHEGFFGLEQWVGFLPNSDRTSLDIHPYICFDGQSAANYSQQLTVPCSTWAANQNNSMSAFGLTTAGEFSNAINDCGLWVNGVNLGTRYEGTYTGSWPVIGSCTPWTDWQNWDEPMKESIKQWALESMDALQNYFFWTWKIGNSSTTGVVESPQWSYQLGLQNGWMPTDPRQADGLCSPTTPFDGTLESWQTGGANAGQVPATATASYPWPPSAISNSGYSTLVKAFPSYTPTGTMVTLPPPTMTASGTSVSVGDGWTNPSDTAMMNVAIASCSYLNPWVGPTAPPSPLCS
ncbi:glycoside hydrolase superfamily [Sparassis latifolia]